MNVACTSESCPIVLNSKCVFYEGAALSNIDVSTNDSVQTVIQKINTAFDSIINNFSAVWGNIGGTVENQLDLIAYLDANYAPVSAGGYWPLTGIASATGAVVINGAQSKTISVTSVPALYGGIEVTNGGGAIWGGANATDYTSAIRGIQVTSTGINIKGSPANYATDLSASFTARSLVDKGYVDSMSGWKITGITNLTGSVSVIAPDTASIQLSTFDGATVLNLTPTYASLEGYTTFRIPGTVDGQAYFLDNRTIKKGIEYFGDYSSTFTARSLVDKAYVDSLIGNAYTAGNGLTLSGTQFKLGGVLTDLNTILDYTGNTLTFVGGDGLGGGGAFVINNVEAIETVTFGSPGASGGGGFIYGGDYSANFTDRSLADWGNVWKVKGTTTTSPDGFQINFSDEGFMTGVFEFVPFTFSQWKMYEFGNPIVNAGIEITTQGIVFSASAATGSVLVFDDVNILLTDGRVIKKGIEYGADYSAAFTNRSLVDKAYVDSLIGTGNFWPLDNNASLLTDVILTQDGFEIRFAGTNANTDVFLDPLNTIRLRVGIDDVGFQYTGLTTEGVVSQQTGVGQLFSFTKTGLSWSSGLTNVAFTQQAAGYFTFDNKVYFTSENSSAPINIGGFAGDIVGGVNGDIWYNSTLNRFRIQQGSLVRNMVDPFAIVEDVTTTTYTFVEADHGKIKRFTHASGCLATVPIGLSLGWTTTAYRGSGAGLLTFASDGVLESAGTTLDSEKTAATIVNRGTNIHVALGAFGTGGGGGGITNTAGANEMMKSDGTNAVSSGIFSNSLGLLEIRNGAKMALKIGADNGATTLTDSTVKWGGFSVPHYTNSEEPFQVIWGDANVSSNTVFIGGNNALANSATSIQFWLGQSNNTTTGNLEATLNSTGFHIGRNATTGRKLSVIEETATTNAVTNIARFTSRSTGTPAAGIGCGIEFQTETALGNDELTGAIESVVTNVAAGNEYADLVFKNFSQGAQLEALRLVATTGYSRMTTTYANGFEISSVLQVSAQTRINNNMKVGIIGDSTIDRRLHVEENGTSTNDTLYAVRLTRICSSGNALPNIGVGIEFETENGASANVVGATYEVIATDVTSGSEDYAFVWKLMAGGAAPVERMRLTSSGSGGLLTMNNLSTGGVTSLYAGEIQLDNIISGDDLTINYNGMTSSGVTTFGIAVAGELFLDPTTLKIDIAAIPTADPGIQGRIYRSGGALQISL